MATDPASPTEDPDRTQLRADHLVARAKRIQLARADPVTFMEVVLKNEETGKPVFNAPHHDAWQDLLDRPDASHPEVKNVVIWAHVESAKSNQVTIGRVLWELGRDPTLRVVIVSNVFTQASKMLKAIAKYIEESDELHQVFPNLKRSPLEKDPWTDAALTVERPTFAKDPSVQAIGLHGAIIGSRTDLLVIDDILDFENTLTKDGMDKTWAWLQSSLHGRLTGRARVWVVGTAFRPEDALHRYARLPGYVAVRYPVLDDEGNPRWPQHWPLERIQEKRATMSPAEYARQLLCVARDDASSRFKMDWLEGCLRRGRGKSLAWAMKRIPDGCKVITGVDLAISKRSSADLTSFFTIIVPRNGDRELLDISAGRWSGPEIIEKLIEIRHRYGTHLFMVENNAAQEYLIQFAVALTDIAIEGFTTGSNKANPEIGIESMAVEFMNSKWVIPNEVDEHGRLLLDDEVRKWVDEILDYDPAQHTGDRLMSSWFAREGVIRSRSVAEQGRVDTRSR